MNPGPRVQYNTSITQTSTSQSKSVSNITTIVAGERESIESTDVAVSRRSGPESPLVEYRSMNVGDSGPRLAETGSQYEQLIGFTRVGSSQTPRVRHSNRAVSPRHTRMTTSVVQTSPKLRTKDTISGGDAGIGIETNNESGYTHNGGGTRTSEELLAYRELSEARGNTEELSGVWGLELLSAPDTVIRKIWGELEEEEEEEIRSTDSSYTSSRVSNVEGSESCTRRSGNDSCTKSFANDRHVTGLHRTRHAMGSLRSQRRSECKRGSRILKRRSKGRKGTSTGSSGRRRRDPSSLSSNDQQYYGYSESDLVESTPSQGIAPGYRISEISGTGMATSGWMQYDSLGPNIRWLATEVEGQVTTSVTDPVVDELLSINEIPREAPMMLEDTTVTHKRSVIIDKGHSRKGWVERETRVLARLYTSPTARQGILIELPSEVFLAWAQNAWAITTRDVIPRSRSWLTEGELEKREDRPRDEIIVVPATTTARRRPMLWFRVDQLQYRTMRAILGITPRIFPLPKPLKRHSRFLNYWH